MVLDVQYSTVQYSTVQYSAVQYSTVQYSTVQYSTVQYSTLQYSTLQQITVQYYILTYCEIQTDICSMNKLCEQIVAPLLSVDAQVRMLDFYCMKNIKVEPY